MSLDDPEPPTPKTKGWEAYITERIATPMSDADLEKYSGIKASDIIKYSDLKNYSKLEELLPTDKSARIVLIEDAYNKGHWVCILRYGDTMEYFNSYSGKWDTDWKFVPKMVRHILGEATNEMTRLFNQAKADGWKTVWNKKKLQKEGSHIQTCGRWCVFRIETMKIGYNLKEFLELVARLRAKEGGVSADWVVARYVA